METTIIALSDPAERVYAALCSYLECIAMERHDDTRGIFSLTRVVLSPGGAVQVGGATLPLIPVSAEVLQRRFRLSPMQARVAELLGARLTNAEIADVLGCASSTARTHVGSVFALLGAHHRDEIAYVLADPSLHDGGR